MFLGSYNLFGQLGLRAFCIPNPEKIETFIILRSNIEMYVIKKKQHTHTELLNIIHLEARRGQVIYSMYSTPEVRLFSFLCWSSTILS